MFYDVISQFVLMGLLVVIVALSVLYLRRGDDE